jgi:FtsP/CotA-like multicopper oxidase with cupredoxin domain
MAPGERKDVVVMPPGDAGSSLVVTTRLVDRGYGSIETRRPVEDLFTIQFAGDPVVPAGTARPLPRASIEPLRVEGATPVDVDLTIAQLPDKSFQYGINGVAFQNGHWFHARPGETQVWTITNKTKWSHPFHLHGFFFQVLDEHNQPVQPLAWKDTVSVPYDEVVRIAVRFDDRPGRWMFHCHILDHADGGLMGMVEVSSAPASAPDPRAPQTMPH